MVTMATPAGYGQHPTQKTRRRWCHQVGSGLTTATRACHHPTHHPRPAAEHPPAAPPLPTPISGGPPRAASDPSTRVDYGDTSGLEPTRQPQPSSPPATARPYETTEQQDAAAEREIRKVDGPYGGDPPGDTRIHGGYAGSGDSGMATVGDSIVGVEVDPTGLAPTDDSTPGGGGMSGPGQTPSSTPVGDPPTTSTPSEPPTTSTPSDPPTTSTPSDPPTTSTPSDPPTTSTPSDPPTTSTPSDPPTTSTPSDPPTTSTPSDPPTTSTPSDPPTTSTPAGAAGPTQVAPAEDSGPVSDPGGFDTPRPEMGGTASGILGGMVLGATPGSDGQGSTHADEVSDSGLGPVAPSTAQNDPANPEAWIDQAMDDRVAPPPSPSSPPGGPDVTGPLR